jgi:hypothetical protein
MQAEDGVLVVFVFEQLAVPTGEAVARLAEELQGLLLVDVAEYGPLGRHPHRFWKRAAN